MKTDHKEDVILISTCLQHNVKNLASHISGHVNIWIRTNADNC